MGRRPFMVSGFQEQPSGQSFFSVFLLSCALFFLTQGCPLNSETKNRLWWYLRISKAKSKVLRFLTGSLGIVFGVISLEKPVSLLWAAKVTWRGHVQVLWSVFLHEHPGNSHCLPLAMWLNHLGYPAQPSIWL